MTQVRDQATRTRDTGQVAESAGILLRVSSDGQDETNQRPELDAYTYERGYRVNRTYQLHDKSAYHGEHESVLATILDDIRAGYISVLVVVHSSRIDRRDPQVAEHYELSVRAAGARIESVREPTFGKADLVGRITTILAQHQNHAYSETLAGHIRAGHGRVRTNRATVGKGLLGRAPWGYEVQGEKYLKTITPDAYGLKYIPEIYSRIIHGDSLATVAAWLNAEGVPTGTRKARDKNHQVIDGKLPTWSAATVNHIVKNPVYKGQQRDSDGRMVNTCEAIVSAAIWNAAQKRLANGPKRGPMNVANRAMLATVLVCDECGSAMYRSTPEKGSTRVYYRCAGKVTGKSCRMVRLALVDSAVDREMSGNPTPVMKMTLIPGRNYDDDIDAIRAAIRALDIDDADYDQKHAALLAERSRLRDLDVTPDVWEPRPTGDTWGSLWDALQPADRPGWLLAKGFTVRLASDRLTLIQGQVTRTVPLAG